jgi:predicted ATPase
MFKKIKASNFAAVPYLETSALMQSHPDGITFSESKPNIIVGPNGAGKSALLTALSMLSLSYLTGQSTLDGTYVNGSKTEKLWARESRWSDEFLFLPGLEYESDLAPAVYYRPNHIPGNEPWINTAIMMGYVDEGKEHIKMVKDKSSGQQALALQERLFKVLAADNVPDEYPQRKWGYGLEKSKRSDQHFWSDGHSKAEVLKRMYVDRKAGKFTLIADEPEQSLDALAKVKMWKAVAAADLSKMQIIIASHSLYPLQHPDKFNIIEAVPGFVDSVRSALQT